jgi:hypothetical protein
MLGKLFEEAKEYPARYRQFAAIRYYLHNMIWECEDHWQRRTAGITNYVTLIDMIDRWRSGRYEAACLVSFNYDRLLEHALDYNRVGIRTIDDYIAHPALKLIKVHGSVNWAREVRNTSIKGVSDGDVTRTMAGLIELGDDINLSDTYHIVKTAPIALVDGPKAAFPAIAIPLTSKPGFECPREHREMLETCFPQVSKLLVIGWRGAESHFLKLFSRLRKRRIPGLVVVGSKVGAKEVVARLRPAAKQVQWESFGGGFSEFVTSEAADRFLSR